MDRRILRVELGIRIEHDPSVGPLASCNDRDVKLIYQGADPGIEWRTFCSCREGQVVAIPFETLTAYSGRADCPPTGRCNFGLNLRLTDPAIGPPHGRRLSRPNRRIRPVLKSDYLRF